MVNFLICGQITMMVKTFLSGEFLSLRTIAGPSGYSVCLKSEKLPLGL